MELSIIIINWKSADYVRKCLSSIYDNLTDLEFEVIVVDNASYDDCEKIIDRDYPQVKFIQSHNNVGFSKANNLGYEHSVGDNLLFLNPDTEIIGTSIKIMHTYLCNFPKAGAIGCKLLNTDRTIQTSSIQAFPTILNQILDAEVLRRKLPNLKFWGNKVLYDTASLPVQVDVISGACILIKRSVFERIGYFSTDYFMYAEDVDLCYKIRKAGYFVYYSGAANVIHHGGKSSGKRELNYFAALVMRESVQKFLHKSRGYLYSLLYRFAIGVAAFCRIMLISLFMGITSRKINRESLKILFVKWIKIFRWSLGLEKWVSSLSHEKKMDVRLLIELGIVLWQRMIMYS